MMQSSPFNLRRAIIWIGRLALAGIFIYAGYSKIFLPIVHPRPSIGAALMFFALQVDSYQLLPPCAVNFVAHTLPFAQIALGFLLLIGWRLRILTTIVTPITVLVFAAPLLSSA